MRTHHHCSFALLGLSLWLFSAVLTDAQPRPTGGRSSGRNPASTGLPPSPARSVAPAISPFVPTAVPATAVPAFGSGVQPRFSGVPSYPGYGYGPSPGYAANPIPAVNYFNYFYLPTYLPATRTRPATFIPPYWYFAANYALLPSLWPSSHDEPVAKEATIEILMPRSDAVLLVDGNKTAHTGLRRRFTSPELEPGAHAYQLTATWISSGREVRLERTIEVSPGRTYFVDFNKVDLTAAAKN